MTSLVKLRASMLIGAYDAYDLHCNWRNAFDDNSWYRIGLQTIVCIGCAGAFETMKFRNEGAAVDFIV